MVINGKDALEFLKERVKEIHNIDNISEKDKEEIKKKRKEFIRIYESLKDQIG